MRSFIDSVVASERNVTGLSSRYELTPAKIKGEKKPQNASRRKTVAHKTESRRMNVIFNNKN
jgi:hypothetical protein